MIPRKVFWLIDAVLLVTAFGLAYELTPLFRPFGETWTRAIMTVSPRLLPRLQPELGALPPLSELAWILVVIAPGALFTLVAIDAYGGLRHISRSRVVLAGPLAMTVGLGFATLVLFALRMQEWSRLFLFIFCGTAAVELSGIRVAVLAYHRWQEKAGYYRRNLLAVTSSETLPLLLQFVEAHRRAADYQFVGYLETGRGSVDFVPALQRRPVAAWMDGAAVAFGVADVGRESPPLERIGTVADLGRMLIRHPIHEVIAAPPVNGGSWLSDVMSTCDNVGVPLRLVPEPLLLVRLLNLRGTHEWIDKHAPEIVLAPRLWNAEALQFKRLIDIVTAALLLLLFSPALAIIAAAVRLTSPGPVFYHWHVIGQNGKRFVGYKFRTMVENADDLKAQLLSHNEMQGPVFKMANDPRVTLIGRWLRKYSLDELPQLYSVLKGDMSLVGPRPAGPSEFQRYEFWHLRKLSIRPGMTCLWQVRGRNGVTRFDEWVKMDLEYIDSWSLWLDFKILVWTCGAVLRGTGV